MVRGEVGYGGKVLTVHQMSKSFGSSRLLTFLFTAINDVTPFRISSTFDTDYGGLEMWVTNSANSLCRYLCRNPAVLTGIGPCRAVSLGNAQKAVNTLEASMNTASSYHLVSSGVSPSDFTL
jgi:hypothetical protein